MEPTETDIAWAAGLFDGKGCIHFRTESRSVTLKLGMTDQTTVQRFSDIIGVWAKISVYQPKNPNHATCYSWTVSDKRRVAICLTKLLPYLITKLDKAIQALAITRSQNS